MCARGAQTWHAPCPPPPGCSAGFHRAKPLHRDYLHIGPTMRASAYIYNTTDEIQQFVAALRDCAEAQRQQQG